MAVATLSNPRTVRRTRRADPRALVGIFLTLAALAGSVAFWVNSSDARPVLIATRDLPVGSTLRATDLSVAYVRMDDSLYRAALPADHWSALVGRQLGEPMHAQQVLARAQVAARAGLTADQVAMTIPARPDSAVDGRLHPGDTVQVLLTSVDKVRGEAHSRVVLEGAVVFDVGREQGLAGSTVSLGGDAADAAARGPITTVTLVVTQDEARQLAEARRSGELDLLLLPPPAVAHP
jgi:Flp pilus assembly protein CpaB